MGKLIVHICCGPDAVFSMFLVSKGYDATGYFYNPCIHPKEEYIQRLEQLNKIKGEYSFRWKEGPYDVDRWFNIVKGLEDIPEGGERCFRCIYMRLEQTAKYAKEKGAKAFTTVLTASPRKKIDMVLKAGFKVQEKEKVTFIPINFKKHGWYEKGVSLSKKFNLYRQNYCGCIYSSKDSTRGKIIFF